MYQTNPLKKILNSILLGLFLFTQASLAGDIEDQKKQLRASVTTELLKAFSSASKEVGDYELSHAMAFMSRYLEADKQLNLTAEQWNQIKAGALEFKPELRLRMLDLVGESYRVQLDQYVEFLSAHEAPDSLAIKAGVETIRGAAAFGFAFLASLIASTGSFADAASIRDGLHAFSLLATIYGLTRPYKVLSIAIRHGEAEERNRNLLIARTKKMHIPEKLLQTSFIFFYLSKNGTSNFGCEHTLSSK